MIDDDIIPPDDILDMTEHGQEIVGALCYAFNPLIGVFPVAYKKVKNGYFRNNYDQEKQQKHRQQALQVFQHNGTRELAEEELDLVTAARKEPDIFVNNLTENINGEMKK